MNESDTDFADESAIETVPHESADTSEHGAVEERAAQAVDGEPGVYVFEPVQTGDVRVDAAIERLAETSTDDNEAAIGVLVDVHDKLHSVLVNP